MSCPQCAEGYELPGEPKPSIQADFQGAYFTAFQSQDASNNNSNAAKRAKKPVIWNVRPSDYPRTFGRFLTVVDMREVSFLESLRSSMLKAVKPMSENSVAGISGFQRFSSAAPLKPVSTNQKCSIFYKEHPCDLGEQVIDVVSIYLQLKFSKGSVCLSPISTKLQFQRISQRPFSGWPLRKFPTYYTACNTLFLSK
jgi:hypothetical protein